MFSRKLLGLVISAVALAASAAPAAAMSPPTPQPDDHIIGVLIGLESQPPPTTNSSLHSTQTGMADVGLASHTRPSADGVVLDLQMPGASTWGSLTSTPAAPVA